MVQKDYYIEQATVEIRTGFSDTLRPFCELTTGSATGFYVRNTGMTHLVTNWHVVTGLHFQTEANVMGGETPKYLAVREWVTTHEYHIPLFQDGKKVWNEIQNKTVFEGKPARIDVVAIPSVSSLHPIEIPVHLQPCYQGLEPHDAVVPIGYPIHRDRPIWKTAHVAESVQPYQSYFLVNGRTKSGMSGSGVFSTGRQLLHGRQAANVLLGIYSGRIDDRGIMDRLNDLDIGIVWKPSCLLQIVP